MADIGKNISRIRLFKMIGQKEMADYLKISQQEYSRIEQKKVIDEQLLETIAQKLACPVDVIKSLEQIEFTNQTFNQNNKDSSIGVNFNSTEKLSEIYERLIKEKDEIIRLLHIQIEQMRKGK